MLAFLAQNIGLGMVAASFAVMAPRISVDFATGRAVVASALSICMMTFGLISPLVGALLQKVTLRTVMVGGSAINAIAFILMTQVKEIHYLIACYMIVGIGNGFLAVVAPITLVSRWFETNRGKVLGFVTAPIFIFLSPIATVAVMETGGLQATFLGLSCIFALLTLLMLMVVDRPPKGDAAVAHPDKAISTQVAGIAFTRQPRFWLLTCAIAMMAGAGTAYFAHSIAYFLEKGIALERGASIFTAFAAAGLFGTSVFGWLADKVNPVPALIVNAVAQIFLWPLLVFTKDYSALLLISTCLGLCLPALNTLQAAALADMFGTEDVPRAMGLSYLVKVPFLLTMAPAIGHVFDVSGSYDIAFLALAAVILVAFATLVVVLLLSRRARIFPNQHPLPVL